MAHPEHSKNMTEKTQAQFRVEGEPAFPTEDTVNENTADSPTVQETEENQTTTDPTQAQGGEQTPEENKEGDDDRGFADHPAWQEREETWKTRFNEQETRHTGELDKLREELTQQIQELGPKATTEDTLADIPSWFGGDEQQWAEFQAWNKTLAEEAKTNALKEVTSKEEQKQKAIEEATKHFESEVVSIESDKGVNPQGAKVDRNKLMKFVMDNDLVTSDGKWNYRAGWQLMQSKQGSTNTDVIDEKKKVAQATSTDGRSETKDPTYSTPEDFEHPSNRPW